MCRPNRSPFPAPCLLLLAPCLLLFLVACTSQPFTVTREPTTLRLIAADSCGPLVEALAAAYEESHPWVTTQVEVFNTSVAEQGLRENKADIALLSLVQERANEEPLWLQFFVRDGVAIVAHPNIPFSETGLALLQEVFRGRVQEWNGVVLTAVSREEEAGTRTAFNRAVLGIHKVTHTAVVVSSSEAVLEYVAQHPGGIGYVSTLRLAGSILDSIRVLPVEGALPTQAAISDGSYPLTRRLYLAATAAPTGEAREFAQWVLGPRGQAIARTYDE